MLITHHAHSEFMLEAENGFRILTDPFDDHVGYPVHEVTCDAVTASHGHGDHSFIQKARGYTVTVTGEGVTKLTQDITVRGIRCFHDDCGGQKRGGNMIYVFEIDGLRVAHFGDLGAFDDALLNSLGDIDIALIPVGGFYTIDAAQAVQIVKTVKPRIVIPMHYKTACNSGWPIAGVDEFLGLMGGEYTAMPVLRVTREDISQCPPVILLGDRV